MGIIRTLDGVKSTVGRGARRAIAALGAALLVAGMLAPIPTRTAAASPSDLPDAQAKASLTVHKYVLPDGTSPGGEASGSQASASEVPADGVPLGGIPFTIRRAYSQGEADALVSQGAAAQGDFSPISGKTGFLTRTGDAEETLKTNETGVATFDLTGRLGTYLVTEGSDPRVEVRAKPFIVSVPMADPGNASKWLYDVHVYPKNYTLGIDKCIVRDGEDVMDASNEVGDENTFRIDADIPEDVGTYTSYIVSDLLDYRLSVRAGCPERCEVRAGETMLVQDMDYTVAVSSETDRDGHACQRVTWDFTKGLAKLQKVVQGDAAGETRVSISFVARLNEHAVNGTLDNGASLTVVNGQGASHTVDSERPRISFGAVRVTKVSAQSTQTYLAGAKFRIAGSLEDAKAGHWTHRLSDAGEDLGVLEKTTDEKGLATFGGLEYDLTSGTDYWLVEVEPPAGFQPMTEPIQLHVGPGAPGGADVSLVSDVQVINAPVSELPATGGTGTALPLVGVAAVALGLAVAGVTVARAVRRAR